MHQHQMEREAAAYEESVARAQRVIAEVEEEAGALAIATTVHERITVGLEFKDGSRSYRVVGVNAVSVELTSGRGARPRFVQRSYMPVARVLELLAAAQEG